MRRQSLRPRQIDIHARMRIVRSAEDLVMDEDATSASSAVASASSAGSGQPHTTTFEELVSVGRVITRIPCWLQLMTLSL